VDFIKCPVVVMYEDSKKDDPVLGKHNFILAMKQRDEKLREEYEAFIHMHNADGINTASSRSREL
jgi:hypothetical protein